MHADMPSTRRWTKVWPVSIGLVFVVGLLVHWAWPQDASSRVVEAASASTTDSDLEDDRPQDIDTPRSGRHNESVARLAAPSVVDYRRLEDRSTA